jgi:hypothetical protein
MSNSRKKGNYMKSMSGRDFVNSLSYAEKKPDDLFVVGMAKLAEDGHDAIMLGPTHKCGPWTKIPLSAIARVVPLATCSCREHEHPVVAVYFKDKDDPVAAALGQLLRNMQKELFSQLKGTSGGAPGTAMARMAGGGTGPMDSAAGCTLIWMPFCWERDFSQDDPRPAARPGDYECIVIPMVYCWAA